MSHPGVSVQHVAQLHKFNSANEARRRLDKFSKKIQQTRTDTDLYRFMDSTCGHPVLYLRSVELAALSDFEKYYFGIMELVRQRVEETGKKYICVHDVNGVRAKTLLQHGRRIKRMIHWNDRYYPGMMHLAHMINGSTNVRPLLVTIRGFMLADTRPLVIIHDTDAWKDALQCCVSDTATIADKVADPAHDETPAELMKEMMDMTTE